MRFVMIFWFPKTGKKHIFFFTFPVGENALVQYVVNFHENPKRIYPERLKIIKIQLVL